MEKKEKDKFFSKINIKDYNNQLEKILEKKMFSFEARNLLLSMFYKIENAYSDYAKTKVEVMSKKEFLEKILNIIEKNLQELILAKFETEEHKQLIKQGISYVVDREKGKIITFANETLLLGCLLELTSNDVCLPPEYEILMSSICNLLNIGSRMNCKEVIKDFNGWSWDIVIKDIEDININLIYQVLIYLIGYENLIEWRNNINPLIDYFSLMQTKLTENYGKEKSKELIKWICKLAVDINIEKNETERKKFGDKKEEYEKELELLQSKSLYIENVTKQKKVLSKQIEAIDKIVNNKMLLKEEYIKRNEKLPNREKIFSISHLVDLLDKERTKYLNKIKEYNKNMEPAEYVKRKQKVKEAVQFFEILDIEKNQDITENLITFWSLFLECFYMNVQKCANKKQILELFYEFRYFNYIPINKEGIFLKDVEKLSTMFKKVKKAIIKQATNLGAIEKITEDLFLNEKIVEKLFESKIIDLDNVIIETKAQKSSILISYYDTTILENTIEIKYSESAKLKKKAKLLL